MSPLTHTNLRQPFYPRIAPAPSRLALILDARRGLPGGMAGVCYNHTLPGIYATTSPEECAGHHDSRGAGSLCMELSDTSEKNVWCRCCWKVCSGFNTAVTTRRAWR